MATLAMGFPAALHDRMIAQMMRASLLATAAVTTRTGLRAINALTQPAKSGCCAHSEQRLSRREQARLGVQRKLELIPTGLTGDPCPSPCSHGCHPFDIVDEGVPGGAAGPYDLLVSVPNGVTEIVATQVFPDVLDRVQLRGIGRQTEQGDIVRNRQALTGLMPTGAVADQHAVGVRVDDLADLGQVDAHDFATDPRHYHSGADGSFRANRSEQPGRVVPIIAHHRRA